MQVQASPSLRPALRCATFSYNAQDPMVMPGGTTQVCNLIPSSIERPSVDDVVLDRDLPPTSEGYVYPDGDERAVAANAFSSVVTTQETFESALGRPIRWAFEGPVHVRPLQGNELNAFYSRDEHAISFSRGWDPKLGQWVYSGASGEVCAHETGHAMLDAMRPRYFGSFAPEVNAFHEAFGDMVAMVMALRDERTLERVLEQTAGDLSLPNAVADSGEQLGAATNHFVGIPITGGDYQRTARNGFRWADPSGLPWMGTQKELGNEPHSFGQVWTGAFYEMVKAMVEERRGSGLDPVAALREAGREALGVLARGVNHAPHGDFTMADMAEAWIRAERAEHGGRWEGVIQQAMEGRGILPAGTVIGNQPPVPAEEPPLRTVDVVLRGPQFGMYDGAVVRTTVDGPGQAGQIEPLARTIRAFVARLIEAGNVKYYDPTHVPTPGDDRGPDGPYAAVVRWENGQMVLEKVRTTG